MPGAVPGKHETLTQWCFNVGLTSETAGQHLNTIGSYTVLSGWYCCASEGMLKCIAKVTCHVT